MSVAQGPDADHGAYRHGLVNGVVAALFAVTGPLAILLAVALEGGLDARLTTSWIFAAHVVGGVLSIVFSVAHRQPLGLAWTIPGAVLLGPALAHITFGEAIGAYLVTGLLLVALGVTGLARRGMSFVPLPLVMAMVAGIFLPFVVGVIEAFFRTPLLTTVMVVAFLATLAMTRVAVVFPPVLAALAAGAVVVAASPGHPQALDVGWDIARPVLIAPVFSAPALLELVVPLALTVVAIQNAQGFAVLRAAGFSPAEDRLTTACGLGSVVGGVLGSVPACVTGPVNAILNSSGPVERRWIGGVTFGALLALFGVLAPVATGIATGLPPDFIVVLGGLALLLVLRDVFVAAFRVNRCPLGALTTFVVTVSGLTILRVGAAFWGLVFGLAVSWLVERDDLRALAGEQRAG